MSALLPDLEAAGLVAYEQARAFEAVQRRNLPLVYGLLTLLLLFAGVVMMKLHDATFADVCFAAGVIFPIVTWLNWRRLKARHAANLQLLAELESKHGTELPWLEVERHLAALAKIQAELDAGTARD